MRVYREVRIIYGKRGRSAMLENLGLEELALSRAPVSAVGDFHFPSSEALPYA